MCPPNNGNGQSSYTDEDRELFTLGCLASNWDIPLFNSLIQSSGPDFSAGYENDLALGEVNDADSSHSNTTSSQHTSLTGDIDGASEEIVDLQANNFSNGFLGSSTSLNHEEPTNNSESEMKSAVLEDIMYPNEIQNQGGQQSKSFWDEKDGPDHMDIKPCKLPYGSFVGKGDEMMDEITNRKRMIQNATKKGEAASYIIEQLKDEKKNYDDMDDDDDQSDDCKRRKLVCKVCGDAASGFHYRVASCEACKAFFKRTVQGNIDYACPASGNCKISPRGRKACQACRFEKCIKMGMLKEGVRSDRRRGGRQKYFRRAIAPSALSSSSVSLSLEENELLRSLKSCNLDTLLSAVSLLEVETMTPAQIWVVLADLFNRHLKSIIISLKLFVGFAKFSLEDKMNILRGSWSEILTLFLVHNSTIGGGGDEEETLKFAPNFILSRSKSIQCGMGGFFNVCQTIAKKINSFGGMHHEEVLILQALILVNSEANVIQKEDHKELRNNLLSLLTKCGAKCSAPSNNLSDAMLRTQNILLLLPCIREADIIMRGIWNELRGIIDPRNQLLIEMTEQR